MNNKTYRRTCLILPAVTIALGIQALAGCSNRSDVPAVLPPLPVKVLTVAAGLEKTTKRFSGYTHPWEAAGVGFLIGGRVTSIPVKEGDHVRKGELLATIDPDDYALVEKLTEAQVDAIKPNYERVVGLIEQDALPRARLDEVEGMYKAAVTQKKQAERQVAYTRLKAPIDGVVMNRGTSVGQVIGPGMPAVIVLNLSKIKVKFGVTQKEIDLFTSGSIIAVAIDGLSEKIDARVFNVALVPDLTTRLFEVTLEIDNPEGAIRPGMLARVEVEVRQAEGFFLPLRAVKRSSTHNHIVYVVGPDNTVVERQVALGDMFGQQVHITGGLKGGEKVIVEGLAFVSPGEKVTVL